MSVEEHVARIKGTLKQIDKRLTEFREYVLSRLNSLEVRLSNLEIKFNHIETEIKSLFKWISGLIDLGV